MVKKGFLRVLFLGLNLFLAWLFIAVLANLGMAEASHAPYQGLATVGSLAPITRTTVMVSDGNEVNIILPDPIDDVVRKTQNDPFAEFAGER